MSLINFPQEEYNELCLSLEKFHEIFSVIWRISRPRFTETIDRAAVAFNKAGGCIDFMINPKFWDTLNAITKEFIICHEICHVMLSHGIRMMPFKQTHTPHTINIALDLAVNHLLVSHYGFYRFNIQDWEKLCWADTVYKEKDLPFNKSFEYYISRIDPDLSKVDGEALICDHDYLSDFDKDIAEKITDLSKEISKEVGKTLEEMHNKGHVGESEIDVCKKLNYKFKERKVKTWESVLKKYIRKKEKDLEIYQWITLNRRLVCLPTDVIVPSMVERTDRDKYIYDIWLFLDCSGSCDHVREIFFKAASTFDPKKFKVRKFTRTTEAHEIIKDDAYVYGGSDDFRCIEEKIQEYLKNGKIKKYPDAILHATDGYDCSGILVEPAFPERWFTFLTQYSTDVWCPKNSHVHYLKDFVPYDV